ncbi:MAG TPA: hypothetical protein V6D47_12880 [Oscillatoriaceae cyanobacterium]
MSRFRFLGSLLAVLLLDACSRTGGAPTEPMQFVLGAVAMGASPAPVLHADLVKTVPAPVATIAPERPAFVGGGGSAPVPAPSAPVGDSYFLLPNGDRVAAEKGDAVPVPQGLSGLVSYFAPGRVPCTLSVDGQGPTTLHPRAEAAPSAPSGHAMVSGQVTPGAPDLLVRYCAPGESAFVATTTDADGRFALEVPLDGRAQGVLLVSDRQPSPRLAIAPVSLQDGASDTAPPLTLATPSANAQTPPPPPNGLTLVQRTLTAFSEPSRDAGGFAWGVPLLIGDPASSADYAFDGFEIATGYTAESPDQSAGSVIGGSGQLTSFLAPPDLSRLPDRLVDGQSLDWEAVPGAHLYTVSLGAPTASAPVWEGASSAPHLQLPEGLKLPGNATVRVCAWDAPELSVYSVAALRAMRLPQSSLPEGRFSWAERPIGVSSK